MNTVVLKTFDSYFDAHIILTKLQDAGIECYLLNENMAGLNPGLSNLYGDIKLVIKDTDAEEAMALLKRFEEDYINSVKCPLCRMNQIVRIPKPGPKGYLARVLIGLIFTPAAAVDFVYHCNNCGWENKHLPEDSSDNNLPYNEEIEE